MRPDGMTTKLLKTSLPSGRDERGRSYFESVQTKIGGFMGTTVTHHSQPVLKTP